MTLHRRWNFYGLLGLLVLVGAWQFVGAQRLAGPTIPSPAEVWAVYRVPWKLALLSRAALSTAFSAVMGLAAGCVLGVAVAIVAHLVVPLQRGLDQFSVAVNAVPAIALGPILIVTVGRDWTPAALATIPVFFVIYVAASSGLRAANPRLMDALTVLGASRFSRLVYLEAPCALPALLGGMRIGVTAAIVGAIVGEWFGASTGLGIVILNTMLNFQIPLLWAAVLLTSSISLSAYALLGVCEGYVRRRFT